jgi:hypothetical protein
LIPGEKSNGFGKRESGGGTTTLHKIVRFFLEKKCRRRHFRTIMKTHIRTGFHLKKYEKMVAKLYIEAYNNAA